MPKRGKRGATLIEVLLSISIFSVVIFFFTSMITYNLRSYNRASTRSLAGEQVRNIVKSVSQSIREMQPSAAGAYPLVSAETDSIIFYANSDADAGIERIRYAISGGKIIEGVVQPTGTPSTYPVNTEEVRTIATNILDDGQPYFTYYTNTFTGTEAAMVEPIDVNQVRLVRVRTLIGTSNTDTSQEDLSFYVHLRNLKDNY